MWKSQYFEFQEINMECEALELKIQHFPNRFYKYRNLNQFTFESIINSEVFLANSTILNDPYECYYSVNLNEVARNQFTDLSFPQTFKDHYNLDFPQEHIDKILASDKPFHTYIDCCKLMNIILAVNADEITKQKWIRCNELIEIERKKVNVCCFTTRNDSMLMWSHYADHHKGVCVEYDFSYDFGLRERIQPVQYCDTQYDITSRLLPDFNPMNISLGTYISALTKAKDWQYEDEWRLIKNNGRTKHPMPLPKVIYLGTRFSQNEISLQEKLFELANTLKIPTIQMKIHNSQYTVEPAI